MLYALHEIFTTLQGEGRNTGKPCVFVRFAGCNLQCPWCDTDFSPKVHLKTEALLARIADSGVKNVIFTGGEPLLQRGLEPLAKQLKAQGYWLGIETNGTIEPPESLRASLDYIATSPKMGAPLMITRAHEVRLVVAEDVTAAWCRSVRDAVAAEDYYLSPCDVGGVLHVHPAITLLGELNASPLVSPWRLSLQTHKLAGIP
ncbi:MAG: 7-carboxy-7-deazaguanine synthase QueE [Kiritimatiellae bacterium]|nr:7-carboxy-7-deazaguanine synthase QueE [Kiritimatiellia bacterium]